MSVDVATELQQRQLRKFNCSMAAVSAKQLRKPACKRWYAASLRFFDVVHDVEEDCKDDKDGGGAESGITAVCAGSVNEESAQHDGGGLDAMPARMIDVMAMVKKMTRMRMILPVVMVMTIMVMTMVRTDDNADG